MSKNAMAGAVTLCGVGLCMIGGALLMQSGGQAHAAGGVMPAAAAAKRSPSILGRDARCQSSRDAAAITRVCPKAIASATIGGTLRVLPRRRRRRPPVSSRKEMRCRSAFGPSPCWRWSPRCSAAHMHPRRIPTATVFPTRLTIAPSSRIPAKPTATATAWVMRALRPGH